ncbi:hypothetical protein [Ralstonia wenshanensis]|uniref:hypothetical protein n=1 Tax=Ralstonia wenshanensis TaxID=2842456 RepID=UPI003D954585
MTRFTTRVELHDANGLHYEILHRAMAVQGFKRTVTSDNGVTYHLPTAEYDFDGFADIQQVLQKAQHAAATTQKLAAIIVTQSATRVWSGLEKTA